MLYEKLFNTVSLRNGVKLPNRVMMAPMCDLGATPDGQVTDEQVTFMKTRANFGALIVTGYAFVEPNGSSVVGQLGDVKESDINGLRLLATAMKSQGNKAILQLSHAGREAAGANQQGLRVVAPSKMTFPWINYDVEEITESEIEQLILDFGKATRRAIDAGFDGIEIHNCNHDLLQQFFSAYSNKRGDKWGGSLEKRMALPLKILEEVRKVIDASKKPDFILGWRISPEEIHDENIGYTVDDMVSETEKAIGKGIDYLNISLTGTQYRYNSRPVGHKQTFAEIFKAITPIDIPVYIGSQVLTPDDALSAVNVADGVYLAREALMEPNFLQKIQDNKIDEIITETSKEHLSELKFPQALAYGYTMEHGLQDEIPIPGL